MKTTDILRALLERLSSLITTPELPIAWPGIPTEPPTAGMWLEARYFPNQAQDLTWDETPHQEVLGFFQLALYYRPGTATGHNSQLEASTLADVIIEHFPKGLAISQVKIRQKPSQGPAVDLEGMSFIPITIPYRGIIAGV